MCTCTEDKFLVVDNGIRDGVFHPDLYVEIPYDGSGKGVIVGRNRVICQECIDANLRSQKEQEKSILLAEIRELENKIFYSQLDGDTEWVNIKMAQRATKKAQLASLNA